MTNVNQYGWKALIGSAVGYAIDGFDLLILGFMFASLPELFPGIPAGAEAVYSLVAVGAGFMLIYGIGRMN